MAERRAGFARAMQQIARTEIRRLARDRRALFSAVLLPALIYPVIFHGQSWLQSFSKASLGAQTVRIALDLEGAPPQVAAGLERLLNQEVPVVLLAPDELGLGDVTDALRDLQPALYEGRPEAVESERALVGRLFEQDIDLLILSAPHAVLPARLLLRVHHDGSDETSNEALARARRALDALEDQRRAELIRLALGADDPARGLDLTAVDVATPEDTGGAALGRLLPLLAVLVLISGGAYAALGTFAGEREAGTLETLLVQPVSASAVAWGKFQAVLLVGLAALVCNVGSMLVSLSFGLGALPGLDPVQGGAVLSAGGERLLLGAAVFLPSGVTICALLALVSARARSFREGQHLLLPLSIVAAVPAGVAGWTDLTLDPLLALTPLFGPCLALRDALRGTLSAGPVWIAVAASIGWAWLAIRALAHTLEAERVLQVADHEREAGGRHLQSRAALRWGLASVLLIYGLGGWAQSRWPLGGLMMTLWLLLPLLALKSVHGTARRAGESVVRALGLRRPALGHALGAALLAPALAQLTRGIASFQERFMPLPAHALEAAQQLDFLGDLSPLAVFFVVALSPGICEELLFRGALLSGLRRDLPPVRAALWQALLFAGAHMSIHRILPTALVGFGLGLIALRSRSLFPAILLHVAYNGSIALSETYPWLADPRLAWLALPGLVLLRRERAATDALPAGALPTT
jgi:sodium transport system permease protein